MHMKHNKKALSCILCMVLMVAMALFTTGCSGSKGENQEKHNQKVEESQSKDSGQTQDEEVSGITTVGEGKISFFFSAYDIEGNETKFQVNTDQATVGEALQELGLIDGSDEAYGLYVTTVNGLTVDYSEDGYYWAFYVDGEYAMKGVDQTEITEGLSYSFKAEK